MSNKSIKIILNEEFSGMNTGWPTRYIGLIKQLEKHFNIFIYAPGNTDLLKKTVTNSWICNSTSRDRRIAKGSLLNFIFSFIKPDPDNIYRSDFNYYDDFKDLVDNDNRSYECSIYFGMSGYIMYGRNDTTGRIICDFCDSRTRGLESLIKRAHFKRKIQLYVELLYVKRIKRTLMDSRVVGIAITQDDSDEISKSFKGKMHVIQNGIDSVADLPEEKIRQKFQDKKFLFLGVLDFAPNVAAAESLINEIWPEVYQESGKPELDIVGRNPVSRISSIIKNDAGITLHADVESTSPFYNDAMFFVVPIYFGAGMKNKVLESLAAGTPVLTTSEAAKGINFQDCKHGYLAENNKEFSRKINEITSISYDDYGALSKASIELAKAYLWESTTRPLIDLIKN